MSKNNIQIGTRIRFLNAQGGGIIRRIQGKVAWVEGEDGFELPTPLHECVPVGEQDTFIPGYQSPQEKRNIKQDLQTEKNHTSVAPAESPKLQEEPLPRMPHLFMPERKGADELSLYLAFLPTDLLNFGHGSYECYLINDCNYQLFFTLAVGKSGTPTRLLASGSLERDTKLFLHEFPLEELAITEHLILQVIAYKPERNYITKPAHSLPIKLDGRRFIRRHAFIPNDFFEEDALVIPLIEHDTPQVEESTPDIESIRKEKLQAETPPPAKQQARKRRHNTDKPIEVDLHAGQLLETSAGMSSTDILKYQLEEFNKVMDELKHHRGAKVVFIHGKGEGVLRKAILDELKRKYPKASAQDASYREYGFGATLVTIH